MAYYLLLNLAEDLKVEMKMKNKNVIKMLVKTKALISCAGYRTADLRLCFHICKKQVFSWRSSFHSISNSSCILPVIKPGRRSQGRDEDEE